MPTLFTKIITGELPGRFVWRDERAVGFLSIEPLKPGHTLVVPIEEFDHWTDLPRDLAAHLMHVSQCVGRAIKHTFRPNRVGLIVAGFEVPHVHLHVTPADLMVDLEFQRVNRVASPEELDRAAVRVREGLRALGYQNVSD